MGMGMGMGVPWSLEGCARMCVFILCHPDHPPSLFEVVCGCIPIHSSGECHWFLFRIWFVSFHLLFIWFICTAAKESLNLTSTDLARSGPCAPPPPSRWPGKNHSYATDTRRTRMSSALSALFALVCCWFRFDSIRFILIWLWEEFPFWFYCHSKWKYITSAATRRLRSRQCLKDSKDLRFNWEFKTLSCWRGWLVFQSANQPISQLQSSLSACSAQATQNYEGGDATEMGQKSNLGIALLARWSESNATKMF